MSSHKNVDYVLSTGFLYLKSHQYKICPLSLNIIYRHNVSLYKNKKFRNNVRNQVAQLGLEPRTWWLRVSYSNQQSYKARKQKDINPLREVSSLRAFNSNIQLTTSKYAKLTVPPTLACILPPPNMTNSPKAIEAVFHNWWGYWPHYLLNLEY